MEPDSFILMDSPFGISIPVSQGSNTRRVLSTMILLLSILRIIYTRWIRNKFYHRPPGPNPLPFIGNIHQLPMEYQERRILEWGKRFGDIIYARFFRRHTIMINSAEVAQDLLAKRSGNYSDRPPFILQCDLFVVPLP